MANEGGLKVSASIKSKNDGKGEAESHPSSPQRKTEPKEISLGGDNSVFRPADIFQKGKNDRHQPYEATRHLSIVINPVNTVCLFDGGRRDDSVAG